MNLELAAIKWYGLEKIPVHRQCSTIGPGFRWMQKILSGEGTSPGQGSEIKNHPIHGRLLIIMKRSKSPGLKIKAVAENGVT